MKNTNLYRNLLVLILFWSITIKGQERIQLSVNSNWSFYKGNLNYPGLLKQKLPWEPVNIPHSWNHSDINDDIPGYYRGTGWYTKKIIVPAAWKGRSLWLSFEGANQTTEVYVNGKKAGAHTGGYTGFNINISPYVTFGEQSANEVTIKVDNSYQANIPPLTADFTFFGGLCRSVYLTAISRVHFNIDKYGGKGIFISTPAVSGEKASVKIRGSVSNESKPTKTVVVTATIKYKDAIVAQKEQRLSVNGTKEFEFLFDEIKSPRLWSPNDPQLYQVITTIRDAQNNELLDETSNPLGFRWFKFDAAKGFYLNGKPLKLIGASRHQDFKDLANAVPKNIAVNDVSLLKEMGGNFLRVAHYPQDPVVLEACDRLGILASVEIPIVNAITESEAFARNCKHMQMEMIRQNYNHPSVIIWTYMNEVLLRPPFAGDSARSELYFKNVAKLAGEIEALTRKEDPGRYTMIPNHGNFKLYHRVGLTKIPMLVGWNLYQGWYTGKFDGFAAFLDMHHQELPGKPLLVTEYGADADNRIHSNTPLRFDKSVEYAVDYHQFYLKAMIERPFVAAAIAWNLADFHSEERMETDPHINNKGLLTIDRKPKDSYFFYQANLLSKPFIKIGLSGRSLLGGVANAEDRFTQQVKVYCNQPAVSLIVNGKKLARQFSKAGIASFQVDFRPGTNVVIAVTEKDSILYQDQVNVTANLVPQQLDSKTLPFESINISLGDQRYFNQDDQQLVWLPEQAYQPGSWGHIGGRVFKMTDTSRLSFGSNKSISGSTLDPIYQTQRVGLKEFKLDVPDGKYEIILHFAELSAGKEQPALAYDLGGKTEYKTALGDRTFQVLLNGQTVISNLGNKNELYPARAVNYTLITTVKGHSGISITFPASAGEAILNGIQVKRIY